jgi:hypothetical protein
VWESLRNHQGLSAAAARKVQHRLLLALLSGPDPTRRSL